MDVVSNGPLAVGARVWVGAHGEANAVIVCKATFTLAPGESTLHPEQEPLYEEDSHWDDDTMRSLSSASDLVPFKAMCDVLLVGSAFAPGGRPARSIVARLVVGEVDKVVEAFCDRAFLSTGELAEGPRVTQAPLRYERAGGGPGTWNPVGVPADAEPDAYGRIALPNLQPAATHVTYPGEFIEPVGFGPIAPRWPSRLEKLGPSAAGFTPERWHERPLPPGLSPAFFNVAPPDQQLHDLRSNERIVLENLHREHERLVTSLPGLAPTAVVERSGGREALALVPDTLAIDTTRGVCTLVWRGTVRLSHVQEAGRVVVSMADRQVADQAGTGTLPAPTRAADPTGTLPAPTRAARKPALPFAPTGNAGAPAPSGDVIPDTPFRSPRLAPSEVEQIPKRVVFGPPPPFPLPAPPPRVGPPPPFIPPVVPSPPMIPPVAPPLVPLPPPEPPSSEPAPDSTTGVRRAPSLDDGEAGDGVSRRAPDSEPTPDPGAGADARPPAPALPPREVTIEHYGAITAAIAMARPDTDKILEAEGLTKDAWEAASKRWDEALREEGERGKTILRRKFDAAYVASVEERRGPITPEEYARLVVATERGTLPSVVGDLSLPRGAPLRIERVWMAKLLEDSRLDDRTRAAIAAEREK